jgi:hypothetical protein
MVRRVRLRKLRKLSDSASEIGFRQTHLRLEGLSEHIQKFREMDEEKKPAKARWLIRKIEFSKPAINDEMYDRDSASFFYWKKERAYISGITLGVAANAVAGVFFASQASSFLNGEYLGGLLSGIAFVGTFGFMIKNTIKNRFANFSSFRNRIEEALYETEQGIRSYLKENKVETA